MGSEALTTIEWQNIADDIEEFAHLYLSHEISDCDYGKEITEIKMNTGKVNQKTIYIVGGSEKD